MIIRGLKFSETINTPLLTLMTGLALLLLLTTYGVQGSTTLMEEQPILFTEESYTHSHHSRNDGFSSMQVDSESSESIPLLVVQDVTAGDVLTSAHTFQVPHEQSSSKGIKNIPNIEKIPIKSVQTLRLAQVLQPGIDRESRKRVLLHHEPPASQQIFTSSRRIQYKRRPIKKWSSLVKQQQRSGGSRKSAFKPKIDMSPISGVMYVPDYQDRDTVIRFAEFTYDSYYEPEDKNWKPVPGWNVTGRFGWDGTGIRGYLFVDESEEILIIVIKGTSLATPIGSGPTAVRDKLNDNMMFSCCCAKAGWEWRPICDCPQSGYRCSMKCLLRESNFDESYYNLAQTIYLAVKEWFPKHTSVTMTGHSLGGALASLVALTNDLPSFAYEAPGDMLYASRLGLLPDLEDPAEFLDSLPIYHFGNDGDPIFLGQCTGVTSSCYWLDYALESKCHLGHECMYSSNPKKSRKLVQSTDETKNSNSQETALSPSPRGRVEAVRSIQYHSIDYVIKNILEKTDQVPECIVKPKCLESECVGWTFVDDM